MKPVSSKLFKALFIAIIVFFPMLGMTVHAFMNEGPALDFTEGLRTASYIHELDLSLIPEFDFTDLNKTWYDHNIEMIIITPNNNEDFVEAVTPLMDWKNLKGVRTIILSNFSDYDGRDDPERIRNMIKHYYETEGIRWVLLAGDADKSLIPIRYVYNPDTLDTNPDNPTSEQIGDDYDKPTDFYYADLTGTWDDDNDNRFGESSRYNAQGIDEIDWTPEVYVGRFPARTATELEQMVNKTIKYESDPYIDDWMNQMLLAGVISDTTLDAPPDGEDEARLTEYIWQNYVYPEMTFTHLYLNTSYDVNESIGNVEKIKSGDDFRDEFNKGYSTVIFAGHGSPTTYSSRGLINTIYTQNQASSCSNANMPSLIYADACTTSPYDVDGLNIGETLIKAINAGAIGYIGGMRVTWYIWDEEDFLWLNRANAKLFWKTFFEDHVYQQGKALYDSKVAYMNSIIFQAGFTSMRYEYQRKNVLTYCLLGDPEVDIYTDKPLSANNSLPETIYEGQLINMTITDNQGKIIPYARVHLTTEDGKYSTVYADVNGVARVRVYPTANETYNVTITGHNLIPTYFNFTTLPDESKPVISSVQCNKNAPTTLDKIRFDIITSDNRSGIESVIILVQDRTTGTWSHLSSRNTLYENATALQVIVNKMLPGTYEFIIITRDYANNTQFHPLAYEFLIPVPLTTFLFAGANIVIAGVAGLSVAGSFKAMKRYSKQDERR